MQAGGTVFSSIVYNRIRSTMKQTKAEKIENKKKLITDALMRCLERDVYSRITVQDVADEAGFSKGGLLYYFPTKEELYLDLMNNLFTEIIHDHLAVIKGDLLSNEKAGISALYGIEKFVMDRKTIKIFINLVLYGFEDERIMRPLREFVRRHLSMYQGIVKEARTNVPGRRKADYDSLFIARIAQQVVFSASLFESVDPIQLDPMKLVGYINSLFKG